MARRLMATQKMHPMAARKVNLVAKKQHPTMRLIKAVKAGRKQHPTLKLLSQIQQASPPTFSVCVPNSFTIRGFDEYADGWNGMTITGMTTTGTQVVSFSMADGGFAEQSFSASGTAAEYSLLEVGPSHVHAASLLSLSTMCVVGLFAVGAAFTIRRRSRYLPI